MKALGRRVEALEGNGVFYTIGELLDSLDGEALADGKRVDPQMVAGLNGVGDNPIAR